MDEVTVLLKTQALPAVVSFVLGPIVTMISKHLATKVGGVMSSRAKLIVTSLAGALAALGVGDVNSLAEAIGTLLTGAIGGLGGAKARDIRQGKTEVSVPEVVNV